MTEGYLRAFDSAEIERHWRMWPVQTPFILFLSLTWLAERQRAPIPVSPQSIHPSIRFCLSPVSPSLSHSISASGMRGLCCSTRPNRKMKKFFHFPTAYGLRPEEAPLNRGLNGERGFSLFPPFSFIVVIHTGLSTPEPHHTLAACCSQSFWHVLKCFLFSLGLSSSLPADRLKLEASQTSAVVERDQ